jgi:hypothetical protein
MGDKENEAGDRNAARRVPAEGVAAKGAGQMEEEEGAEGPHSRWARHCHATLGAVSTAAVLKASR